MQCKRDYKWLGVVLQVTTKDCITDWIRKILYLRLKFYYFSFQSSFTAGIYLLKVNKRSTRTRCEICSKLTIKIPERRQWLSVRRCNIQKKTLKKVGFVSDGQFREGSLNFNFSITLIK